MTEWTAHNLREWDSLSSLPNRQALSQCLEESETYVNIKKSFVNYLLRQSKLLSQLIATSWLEGKKATEIRAIFTKATGNDQSELKALLTGKKPKLWDKAIFDEQEIEMYRFQITWNAFEGTLIEHPQALVNQTPPYFTVLLPYPPRPALSEFTVTYEQIEDWVNSKVELENGIIKNPFPPYPYIPLTTS